MSIFSALFSGRLQFSQSAHDHNIGIDTLLGARMARLPDCCTQSKKSVAVTRNLEYQE
ncbi:MAG: hypothetical protein M3430_00015 [Acidobacteriota bacterium]|nr:hypothetical protein [Acidobacteriota bacterium]